MEREEGRDLRRGAGSGERGAGCCLDCSLLPAPCSLKESDFGNAPARTHRAAAAWHFIRRILTDIRGAVPLHAFEGLRHWRRRGQAIAAIHALDDRILRDIGIDRNTIRESVDAMIQAEAGGRVS